ncbi:transposase [Rhizobium sp. BK313]|uniref:helix-turn-helix domain-containing protein n=1 Tax=Rhizobium sp. BK313 TaxID=2587081 RepID=UPI001061C74A|nr:transposase [Rhizobium sp. BK313]
MGNFVARGFRRAELSRRLARQTRDAAQARCLLALASIYDRGSRSDAARLGNVTLQIVRDWVMRFKAHGPDGLINGKAPGPKSRLNDTQRAALAQANGGSMCCRIDPSYL